MPFSWPVLQRRLAGRAQDTIEGITHGVDRKAIGRRQATGKGNHFGPYGDFQDLANGRAVEILSTPGKKIRVMTGIR